MKPTGRFDEYPDARIDGLTDKETEQQIDVIAELKAMREQVTPKLQPYLDIAVQRISKAKRQ